jgi:predicted metal-binding membrane protein
VVPSWRLRQRQVEDVRVGVMGCVGPCYPTFAVFNVLGIRGIVVIYPFTWADI